MKILHVMPSYIPAYRYGGPIKAVHELCKALVKKGVGASVFTTNIDLGKRLDVPLNDQQNIEGVKVTYFPVNFPAAYCYSRDLHKAIKREAHRFDIVHIHSVFLYTTYIAAYYCRRKGIPYIVNPFGALDPGMIKLKNTIIKNIYINMIERRNIINAATVHAASVYEKEQFLALGFNVPVAVVPRGLNLKDYVSGPAPKDIRRDYPQLEGKKIILFLGRIHLKKGLDLLAEGFKKVIDNRRDVSLLIAGPDEDNYSAKITRLLKKLGISDHVFFTGMLLGNEKIRAFYSSDIFVLPSYGENFGITLLEAMACRLPVVISNRVGLSPDIREYNAGIVVDCDPVKIAEAILRLLDRDGLRKTMGENGRMLVEDRFTWERVVNEMLKVYASVIRKN